MRILNINKVAFFALLFCLLNMFTVVMSKDNLTDIENTMAVLGTTKDHSLLTPEINETSIYENPLVNNNNTTGFVVNSSTIPALENGIKNQTLADHIGVVADFGTDNPIKNETLTLVAEDLNEGNSTFNIEQFRASQKTLCEQTIVNAKNAILLELDKDLEKALEYSLLTSINNSKIYDLFEKILQNIFENKNVGLPETIHKSCNNSSFVVIEDLLSVSNDLNMKIIQNLRRFLKHLLNSCESKRYEDLGVEVFYREIVGIIRIKEQKA